MAVILGGLVLNGSLSSVNENSSKHFAKTTVQHMSLTEVCLGVIFNKTGQSTDANPDGNVSEDIETISQKFKLGILLVLFVIGVPANVINMAVFYKQSLQDRVNLCLFSLSFTDAFFLIACLCLNSENIHLLLSWGAIKSHWNADMVNHQGMVYLGTGYISLVLSAIIACERCYCVLNPLKYQTWLRTRTMAIIILSVYFVVSGLFFVVVYKYRVGCFYDSITGVVTTALIEGEAYKAHKELIDSLEGFVFGLIICGGTMIVVITATVITTVKLRQHMTWRAGKSSALSSRDVALTKMLIGSSMFFILCASPACFCRIVWFFLPEMNAGGEQQTVYLTTLWIVEGFCYINYTFNFFIYYVMGSRFRDTFSAICCKSAKQEQK